MGVHEGAIQSFFAILNKNNIPKEQWPTKLLEIAKQHNELLKQVQAMPQSNAAMGELKQKAETAIQANRYDEADALLTQLLELQGQEQAATWASRGGLAMTRLRYAEAAQHFANAAQTLPQTQETQRIAYLEQEAYAWYSQGDEFGDHAALEKAIQLRKKLLEWHPRSAVPLNWARAQVNLLGLALWQLGERETGTTRLEEAVHVFREALKEYTQDHTPLGWATAQNNLGIALRILGERESGTEKLYCARSQLTSIVIPAQAGIQEVQQAKWIPAYAGMTEQEVSLMPAHSIEEAMQAFREALKARTRDRVPLDWAATQNNLGLALQSLGEQENSPEKLAEAMTAYQNALEVAQASGASYYIQMYQSNLQKLRATLAKQKDGT
ncbi:MAG: hypothetical protein HQL87_16130 [Magnetococcales bacterium]|nr:hypothetical protein [Magnetococcales bacterium]